MDSSASDWVSVGKITSTYGVKGWVKIHSYTDPMQGILQYNPWHIKTSDSWEPVTVEDGRLQGKTVVARLRGIADRDAALALRGAQIAIPLNKLEVLAEGEYYWHQLRDLRVMCDARDGTKDLGFVADLLATGGNDVLVVKGDERSIDDRERLIPYVREKVVIKVDTNLGEMWVDWDPDY